MSAQGLPIVLTETKTGQQFDLNSKQIVQAFSQGINGPNTIVGPAANTTTGIVAHAGGGQASATVLAAIYNIVTTVATAGDSVKLPVAVVGTWYVITNSGAASLNIFPATSGTINGGSANAAIALLPGAQIMLVGSTTLNWNTCYPSVVYYLDNAATLRKKVVNEEIVALAAASNFLVITTNATGQNLWLNVDRIETYFAFFSPLTGPASISYPTAVAHAGGGQVTTTDPSLLTANQAYTTVITAATAGDSITLPAAAVGSRFVIYNNTAVSINVFAFTSGTINGGSANGSIAVAPGVQTIFSGDPVTAGNWISSSPVVTRVIYNTEQDEDKIFDITQSVATLSTAIDLIISPELATTPQLAGANVFTGSNTFSGAIVENTEPISNHTAFALNATGSLTGAQVKNGYVTTTSAAAVTMTMPTGTDLGGAIGAVAGTRFKLIIDNTAGSNVVTMAVGVNNVQSDWDAQITAATASVTPAAITPLTVNHGVTGMAEYTFLFSAPTVCTFSRTA